MVNIKYRHKTNERANSLIKTILLTLATILFMVFISGFARSESAELKDHEITNAIETEILLDRGIASHMLDVKTTEGVVTLSGKVNNLFAKERTLNIARSVKGVKSIIDRIEVTPIQRSNEELKKDINDALLFDPATEAYEIEVHVNNGSITLTGQVESNQERYLCEELVKGVKGVKAVNNEIQVYYPEKRPDSELKKEIERLLKLNIWIEESGIDVKVENGHVDLSGRVGSLIEREKAYTNSWVFGVKSVSYSDLEIQEWTRRDFMKTVKYQNLSDKDVENYIRQALVYDPKVVSTAVTAKVDTGVATLTGIVDNLTAKKAAEEDARNTMGVWRVRNLLKVRPKKVIDDDEMQKLVEQALSRDPYLDRFEIIVTAMHGKVFLYGEVDSYFEKQHAEDIASKVKYVVAVENHLVADTSWYKKNDWEIKQDIENELLWNPYIDKENVIVKVEDGVASLSGKVTFWHQWLQAQKEAYQGGAKEVRNKLKVVVGPLYYH